MQNNRTKKRVESCQHAVTESTAIILQVFSFTILFSHTSGKTVFPFSILCCLSGWEERSTAHCRIAVRSPNSSILYYAYSSWIQGKPWRKQETALFYISRGAVRMSCSEFIYFPLSISRIFNQNTFSKIDNWSRFFELKTDRKLWRKSAGRSLWSKLSRCPFKWNSS